MADVLGIDWRVNKNNPTFVNLKMGNFPSVDKSVPGWWRYAMVLGELKDNEGNPSQYNCRRYAFLLDAPFNVSAKCCNVMKKSPAHIYSHKTGRLPITAQMASESRLRASHWLNNGCNGFDMKSPISNPMSFWFEQDVLAYIVENDLEICSMYGDIVPENKGQLEGQMNLFDLGIFDLDRPTLKTTGCKRTGCMFCGYGCHLEKESDARFVRMKETHPKQYEWIMKPWEEGGLGYKEVIDWINENGNLKIKY